MFYGREPKDAIKKTKMNVITKTVSLPDGRQITVETGKLAKQADGSYTPYG